MEDCILCELDEENPTFIKDFDYWTLLINYAQPTLGSTLLVLNRHVESLSEVSEEEARDYWKNVGLLEEALRKSFNPQRINYLMLANVVTHAHYHVVPRYEEKINFAGKSWFDENYGHFPILRSNEKDQETLDRIRFKILENI